MMLSCIAAVAIASFVGKKAFEPHAYEAKDLLLQNVEALTSENSVIISRCKGNTDVCAKGGVDEETGKEIIIHGKLIIIANI